MTKIICHWDMCTHNARCHADVEAECTKDNVEFFAYGDREQFLKCKDFKSIIKTTKGENNNE